MIMSRFIAALFIFIIQVCTTYLKDFMQFVVY